MYNKREDIKSSIYLKSGGLLKGKNRFCLPVSAGLPSSGGGVFKPLEMVPGKVHQQYAEYVKTPRDSISNSWTGGILFEQKVSKQIQEEEKDEGQSLKIVKKSSRSRTPAVAPVTSIFNELETTQREWVPTGLSRGTAIVCERRRIPGPSHRLLSLLVTGHDPASNLDFDAKPPLPPRLKNDGAFKKWQKCKELIKSDGNR